jgi:hypothetical protein
MKRNLELVRHILLALERNPFGYPFQDLHIDGYTPMQVEYHALLMLESGLVAGHDVSGTTPFGPAVVLTRLTWQGHEFLESARDDFRWHQALQLVTDRLGGTPLTILQDILTLLMRQDLEISPLDRSTAPQEIAEHKR